MWLPAKCARPPTELVESAATSLSDSAENMPTTAQKGKAAFTTNLGFCVIG